MHTELETRAKEARDAVSKVNTTVDKNGKGKKAAVIRAEQAEETVKKAKQTEGSIKDAFEKLRKEHEDFVKAKEASDKVHAETHAELQKKLDALEQKAQEAEARHAEAIAELKSGFRTEAEDQSTDTVKEFGNLVGENFPHDARSVNNPDFITWKTQIDTAADILSQRKQHADAAFLRGLSNLLTKGLERYEELPDHRDLTMSSSDFNTVRALYHKMKENSNPTIQKAAGSQWGTIGQNIRTMLLGHSGEWGGSHGNDELRAAREKILFAKTNPEDAGVDVPGVKAKKRSKK